MDVASLRALIDETVVAPTSPTTPTPRNKIGGTLTRIRVAWRRVGPDNRADLLEREDRRRIYRIEPALVEGLKGAFDPADARPDLLRQEST